MARGRSASRAKAVGCWDRTWYLLSTFSHDQDCVCGCQRRPWCVPICETGRLGSYSIVQNGRVVRELRVEVCGEGADESMGWEIGNGSDLPSDGFCSRLGDEWFLVSA